MNLFCGKCDFILGKKSATSRYYTKFVRIRSWIGIKVSRV